jgi:zona occludens toxin (predicted ATPase)
MPFLIAVSALFTISSAYLLYQFFSRAFVSDAPASDAVSDPEAEALKAA